MCWNIAVVFRQQKRRKVQYEVCKLYTRTLPWKNHQSELTIVEQNQRIAAYLAEHKELDLLRESIPTARTMKKRAPRSTK